MFQLKVDNFYRASDLMDTRWPTSIISLIAPDEDRCHSRGDHHLRLRFDDSEQENDLEWTAPTREHVELALRHTEGLTDEDHLLVHCTAGKSRSTAIAMGVLIQHGMTPQQAFDQVAAMRPALIPNRLIVRYIDEILALDGAFIAVVDQYYTKLPIIGGGMPEAMLKRHNIDD